MRPLYFSLIITTVLNTWLWSQSKQEPEEKPKFPSLEKKIKKAKKIEGFFKLYKEDNQVYLALNKDQLEEEFYLFTSLSKGTFGGILMPHWTLDQKLVYFKRVNKKILLFQKDSYHKADKDSPTEKAVRKAYLDSLVHSFAILATDKEESVFLLRLNSYFFSAGARLFPPWLRSGAGISGIDSSNTFWSKIKAFPKRESQTNTSLSQVEQDGTVQSECSQKQLNLIGKILCHIALFTESPKSAHGP